MWTDKELKSMPAKPAAYVEVESTGRRGTGRLAVKVYPTGAKTFFYRYSIGGRYRFVKIGGYRGHGGNVSLAEAREKARELEQVHQAEGDVKSALQTRGEVEAKVGTFMDLLQAYFRGLEARGKTSVARYQEDFARYVATPFPWLLTLPANKVTTDHVVMILRRMIVDLQVTRGANYTRGYLHAAFQSGIKADNDPRAQGQGQIKFGLQTNPVSAIPKQADFERQGERTLSEIEVRDFWGLSVLHMPFRAARCLRLMLALAAPRPIEMRMLEWAWVDLERRLIEFPESVMKMRKKHVVPFGELAYQELRLLKAATGGRGFVFPHMRMNRVIENVPPTKEAISEPLRVFVNSDPWAHPAFAPYDLRRTAKTLMGKAGVPKDLRDRLQGHAQNDVSSKHYDRYDYLPEKRQAAEAWDSFLSGIVGGW